MNTNKYTSLITNINIWLCTIILLFVVPVQRHNQKVLLTECAARVEAQGAHDIVAVTVPCPVLEPVQEILWATLRLIAQNRLPEARKLLQSFSSSYNEQLTPEEQLQVKTVLAQIRRK